MNDETTQPIEPIETSDETAATVVAVSAGDISPLDYGTPMEGDAPLVPNPEKGKVPTPATDVELKGNLSTRTGEMFKG
jgi:hypothetical protein